MHVSCILQRILKAFDENKQEQMADRHGNVSNH